MVSVGLVWASERGGLTSPWPRAVLYYRKHLGGTAHAEDGQPSAFLEASLIVVMLAFVAIMLGLGVVVAWIILR